MKTEGLDSYRLERERTRSKWLAERVAELALLIPEYAELSAAIGQRLAYIGDKLSHFNLPINPYSKKPDVALWAETNFKLNPVDARRLVRDWRKLTSDVNYTAEYFPTARKLTGGRSCNMPP